MTDCKLFLFLFFACALLSPTAVHAQNLHVIDGDTVRDLDTNIVYRLEGIDAPEEAQRVKCKDLPFTEVDGLTPIGLVAQARLEVLLGIISFKELAVDYNLIKAELRTPEELSFINQATAEQSYNKGTGFCRASKKKDGTDKLDKYGRVLGVCGSKMRPDVNKSMVEEGLAQSYYSNSYKKEQLTAQKAKTFFWKCEDWTPSKWRKQKKTSNRK